MDRARYFYRILVYTKKDGQVALKDRYDPDTTVPLEPWLGMVVSLADGQHTIEELIKYLGSQYKDGPPADLEKTVDSVIDRLVKSEVIQTSDKPFQLPYYLAIPEEEQDKKKAGELMIKDGYIKH